MKSSGEAVQVSLPGPLVASIDRLILSRTGQSLSAYVVELIREDMRRTAAGRAVAKIDGGYAYADQA